MTALADIGVMQAVRAGPSDLFVVRVEQRLTEVAHARIREVIERSTADWGFVPKIMILDGGISLSIVAPAQGGDAVAELVAAVERRWAILAFPGMPDDRDIGLPETGITFGMIRRARAEIGGPA